MITPRFRIEQTEETIVIHIVAPYTDIKQTEIHVLEDDFRFYSAPYYLRLNLPGKVEEGEQSGAKYEVESHSFVITLDKMMPGEVFPNLDMLTVMLQPKTDKPSAATPLIEVMSSSGISETGEAITIDPGDWFINQTVETDLPAGQLLQKYKYGFASRHSGLGRTYSIELAEVTEIQDPDSVCPSDRITLQEETENDRFSDDHYFQDLMVTDLSQFLNFTLKISKFETFTDSDRECLKNLVNHEFLLDKTEQLQLFLGVVDIIFAYLYDLRINIGKCCIESQWNVSRISATLSYFRTFTTVDSTTRSCIRRSLSFPLYRHWDLSMAVLHDTLSIIEAGSTPILKCFLAVHRLFSKTNPYYLLNQLFIDEYCVWIQQANSENWKSLATGLKQAITTITKEEVGFDLCCLDVAAQATLDEAMEEEMTQQVSEIDINK